MRESTSCSLLGQQLALGALGVASSLCGPVSALPWVLQSTGCQENGHIGHLHTDHSSLREWTQASQDSVLRRDGPLNAVRNVGRYREVQGSSSSSRWQTWYRVPQGQWQDWSRVQSEMGEVWVVLSPEERLSQGLDHGHLWPVCRRDVRWSQSRGL